MPHDLYPNYVLNDPSLGCLLDHISRPHRVVVLDVPWAANCVEAASLALETLAKVALGRAILRWSSAQGRGHPPPLGGPAADDPAALTSSSLSVLVFLPQNVLKDVRDAARKTLETLCAWAEEAALLLPGATHQRPGPEELRKMMAVFFVSKPGRSDSYYQGARLLFGLGVRGPVAVIR